jgi:peptide/nickel transport system substrate-binding protein
MASKWLLARSVSRLAALAAAALALAAGGAYAQQPKNGGTLVWGTTQVARHFNPAVQSGIATMMPGAQIFASPLRFDDKWNPQPYLAESWSFQDDGKSLLLKLVPNAKFHDGKPVTSADVAFSIMTAKANHPFQSMLAAVERVDTPDPRVAVVRMSQPHPAILLALSPPFLPVLPKHIYGDGTDPKNHPRNTNPVGSGAYRFVEYKPGEHLILEKNPDYFIKGRPHFDRIVFKIYKDPTTLAVAVERKEVHFVPFWLEIAMLDRLEKVPGVAATNKGGEAIGPINWLAINTKKKPLDDVRVRKAIAYAIDRDFIVKKLHGGRTQPALGPITPTSPFYNAAVEPYKLDLAKANKLLDEAGLKRGADGARFALTVDYIPGARENHQNIAEYLKPQLKKIGIDVTVRAAPDFPTWAKRVGGHDFDLTTDSVFNWGDPVIGVHRTYLSSNIRQGVIWSNTQSYSNPKVDELLAKAGVERDRAKRKALYQEFQKIVVDEAPIVFLNLLPYYMVYDKSLKNLPLTIWGAGAPIDEMHR